MQSLSPVNWWKLICPSMWHGFADWLQHALQMARMCLLQGCWSTLLCPCGPPFSNCSLQWCGWHWWGGSRGSGNICPCCVVSYSGVSAFAIATVCVGINVLNVVALARHLGNGCHQFLNLCLHRCIFFWWLVCLQRTRCWHRYLQSAGSILVVCCHCWPFGWLICTCCIVWSCHLYSACICWSPPQFSQNMPWFGQNWFWWWLVTIPMSACLVCQICYCRRFPQDKILTCRHWV